MFTTYASPGQFERGVAQMKEDNLNLVSLNIPPTPLLVGENWIIKSEDAVALQPKMGGTILR